MFPCVAGWPWPWPRVPSYSSEQAWWCIRVSIYKLVPVVAAECLYSRQDFSRTEAKNRTTIDARRSRMCIPDEVCLRLGLILFFDIGLGCIFCLFYSIVGPQMTERSLHKLSV